MEYLIENSIHWSGPSRGTAPPLPDCDGDDYGREQATGADLRVYVVEDEAVIAMDLSEWLTALGYEVCGTTTHGETAVQKIAELRPDLVLMDVRLAGAMDGVTAAQQLREHYDVPVVFLTAYSDSELIARATRTNCYGFLVKPLDERELHATLQVALARFRELR
jgi:AmiR/NasT family two-component response regulator